MTDAPTPSLTNPNPKREDERVEKATDVIGYLNVYRDDDGDLVTGSSDLCATAEEASDFDASDFADHVGVFALVPAASARPSPGDPVRAALEEAVAFLEMDDEASNPGTDLYTWLTVVGRPLSRAAISVSTPTGEGEACDWVKLPSEADLAEIIDDCLAVNNPGDGGSWAGAAGAIASSLHSRSERKPSTLGDNDDGEIARVMAMSDDEVLAEGGDPEQASLFVNAAFDRAKVVAENCRLRSALERARNVLGNMAAEHATGWRSIFARWPIHHEPLRSDARHLLPVIDAALFGVAPSQKPGSYVSDEHGTPITGLSWCAAQPHEKNTSHCPACGVGPLEACRGRVPQDDEVKS